jgi:leader peptidase (prepilin peptidase)/N-methyltransferase
MPVETWTLLGWAVGGLVIGSFLNVLIHRWPRMLAAELGEPLSGTALSPVAPDAAPFNLSHPRSHCPHCGTTLRWPQLVPVLSFLWQRGRCGHCHHPIAWRYPVVELLAMTWWIWCGLHVPALPGHATLGLTALILPGSAGWGPPLAWALWGSALLALAWIDWDSTWLPDGLTQPLVWGGLLAAQLGWTPVSLSQALTGAMLGYLSLWSVATVFRWVTGQEGMGGGDFKLLAALGAWLGPWLLIPLVLLASLGGLVAGLALRLRGQLRDGRYVPFGPFLVAAAVALRLGLDRVALGVWGMA